ncbi:MAG: FkbM family methyltransferase, partial [Proteobacteria bacterium]
MSFGFALVRPRWVRKLLRPVLNRPRFLRFQDGRKLAVILSDLRGPSFHMSYGYRAPERALDGFEPEGRRLVESSLRARAEVGESPVFLDIGANIGLYAFSAVSAVPAVTVYGFEPHPRNVACLLLTKRANHWRNVHLEKIALGDQLGPVNLYLDESDTGSHSLNQDSLWNNQASTACLRVPCATLDAWVERRGLIRVDVIKLDVKGAEGAVLRGGMQTLRQFRPNILAELQHEALAEDQSFLSALKELPFSYRVR